MTPKIWQPVDSFNGNHSASSLMNLRACPVCGGKRHRMVLGLDQFQFFSDSADHPKRTDIRQKQCRDCLALFLNPGYSNKGFGTLFAEAGCSYGATSGRAEEQLKWLGEQHLFQPGTYFLDVGCYDGQFLAQLPIEVDKCGFDVDLPAIERGRSRFGQLGIEFIHGEFSRFRPRRSPDVITMFHVLEHLPEPVAALQNLRDISHSGSRLVVEVPILELGLTNDINGFFSVQHMTHFSRSSLKNCLARAGWVEMEWLEQQNYNGCRVLCRPGEARRQVEGNPGDFAALDKSLRQWYAALRAAEKRLAVVPSFPRWVIWGGGMHTELLYHLTSLFSHDRTYLVVDSDSLKQGKSWRGIPIRSPDILPSIDWQNTGLLISSYGGTPAISQAAKDHGVPPDRVFSLYENFRLY